jgi:hypothetical protein
VREQQSNNSVRDLTQGNITRELFSLALPLLAISFIQMAYNLIDILWIGRIGSEAVAAVGSIGMLMWMMNSFALISKVGAEITIGQSIGARRLDKASIYASHTTTIAIILGIAFGVTFFLFPNPYVSFYQLENDIAAQAEGYLRIISLGIPFVFLGLNFSGIYIGSGRSDIPFYFNSAGLIINIIVDPLLIFGIGPFPEMGVKGAALATIISQGVVVFLFINHLKKERGLFGGFSYFIRPRKSYTINILKLGLPIAAMNVYFAFINMNLARIASLYGGHLEIIIDRLKREFKVEANQGRPQVTYKEAITKSVELRETYKKQTGGRGKFADMIVRVEPADPDFEGNLQFIDEVKGGNIPKEYIPSIQKGFERAMKNGVLAGYSMDKLKVTVIDGSYHAVDSDQLSFEICAMQAYKSAVEKAGPVLLEPIMKVEVVTPEESMGDVISDLNKRRGQVEGMESNRSGARVVKARTPLAEMFGYVTSLRTITSGRATSTMSFSHFEPVSASIAKEVLTEVGGRVDLIK